MKKKISPSKQLKIIDAATSEAIKQVELEFDKTDKNYFVEWFRYIELTSKQLQKYLN